MQLFGEVSKNFTIFIGIVCGQAAREWGYRGPYRGGGSLKFQAVGASRSRGPEGGLTGKCRILGLEAGVTPYQKHR